MEREPAQIILKCAKSPPDGTSSLRLILRQELKQRGSLRRVLACVSVHKKDPSDDESFLWSGRRGSNSRHLPWQGSILPLNYPRLFSFTYSSYMQKNFLQVLFIFALNLIISSFCQNTFVFLAIHFTLFI